MANALLPVPRDNGDLLKFLDPLVASWTGVPNKGVPLLQTQINDPTNYAGDFANLDTAGTPTRKSLRAVAGTHSLLVNGGGIALTSATVSGLLTLPGGMAGAAGTFTGLVTMTGGLTATTGTFSNLLTAAAGLTATSGTLNDAAARQGGATGKTFSARGGGTLPG